MLKYLDESDVAMLLKVASRAGVTGKRNAAVLALMYYGGLRVGECCHLRADAIDRRRMELRVPPEGKTGEAIQPLPSAALVYLDRWERVRPRYLERNPSAEWYFLSLTGSRCDRTAIYREVRRYGTRCGLHVTPHMLRHSLAMSIMRNPEATILDVQAAMRHKDLSSTMVYLHADKTRLAGVLDSTFG